MGNYISCTLAGPVSMSFVRVTKVILPNGKIHRLCGPAKAAELMLEKPNFFLVNAKSLKIGTRFSALNANEDLEIGGVYVFFPMTRLKSVVTDADMGMPFLAANSAAKRAASILPECGGDMAAPPKLNLDEIEEFSTPEFKHRLSMCRSKKPLLETIVEEPVCLR